MNCPFCGAFGAYTVLTSIECIHPFCERFSPRLAEFPFTLEKNTLTRYKALRDCLATTPESDLATRKKLCRDYSNLLSSRLSLESP